MAGERPILVVDDDRALRATLAEQLAVEGEFAAVEAATLSEAESLLGAKDARFDALILDVRLPDGDGRDFCVRLRRQGLKIPIVMLTGSDQEADVVRGLDWGPTTISPSRSAWPNCWRGSALSCVSSRTARTPFS